MTSKFIGFPIVPGEKTIWWYQRDNHNP